jgi:hypothetical protein
MQHLNLTTCRLNQYFTPYNICAFPCIVILHEPIVLRQLHYNSAFFETCTQSKSGLRENPGRGSKKSSLICFVSYPNKDTIGRHYRSKNQAVRIDILSSESVLCSDYWFPFPSINLDLISYRKNSE